MMPVSMVGRAGELAELDRAWSVVSAAGRSAPTVAVITGAAEWARVCWSPPLWTPSRLVPR